MKGYVLLTLLASICAIHTNFKLDIDHKSLTQMINNSIVMSFEKFSRPSQIQKSFPVGSGFFSSATVKIVNPVLLADPNELFKLTDFEFLGLNKFRLQIKASRLLARAHVIVKKGISTSLDLEALISNLSLNTIVETYVQHGILKVRCHERKLKLDYNYRFINPGLIASLAELARSTIDSYIEREIAFVNEPKNEDMLTKFFNIGLRKMQPVYVLMDTFDLITYINNSDIITPEKTLHLEMLANMRVHKLNIMDNKKQIMLSRKENVQTIKFLVDTSFLNVVFKTLFDKEKYLIEFDVSYMNKMMYSILNTDVSYENFLKTSTNLQLTGPAKVLSIENGYLEMKVPLKLFSTVLSRDEKDDVVDLIYFTLYTKVLLSKRRSGAHFEIDRFQIEDLNVALNKSPALPFETIVEWVNRIPDLALNVITNVMSSKLVFQKFEMAGIYFSNLDFNFDKGIFECEVSMNTLDAANLFDMRKFLLEKMGWEEVDE